VGFDRRTDVKVNTASRHTSPLCAHPLILCAHRDPTSPGKPQKPRQCHSVLTPNEFPDLKAVERRLLDFQAYYETVARPFEWKFTRTDLDELLVELARREERQRKAVA